MIDVAVMGLTELHDLWTEVATELSLRGIRPLGRPRQLYCRRSHLLSPDNRKKNGACRKCDTLVRRARSAKGGAKCMNCNHSWVRHDVGDELRCYSAGCECERLRTAKVAR